MRTWLEKEKSHIKPSRAWKHRYLLIDQPSYSLLQNITNRVITLDANEQASFIEPDMWHFLLLSNHLLKLHLLAPNLGHFPAPIGQRELFHFVKIPIHLNAQVAILQVMLSSNYAFSKDLGKTTETILTVHGPSSVIYLFAMFKVHFCQNDSSFLLLWPSFALAQTQFLAFLCFKLELTMPKIYGKWGFVCDQFQVAIHSLTQIKQV